MSRKWHRLFTKGKIASSPSSSCAPASNTASHDNHEKINSWVSFTFYEYGAPPGGLSPLGGLRPPELRYNYRYVKMLRGAVASSFVRSFPERAVQVRAWLGTWCVLWQDILLSQCLSPPRIVSWHRRIVGKT